MARDVAASAKTVSRAVAVPPAKINVAQHTATIPPQRSVAQMEAVARKSRRAVHFNVVGAGLHARQMDCAKARLARRHRPSVARGWPPTSRRSQRLRLLKKRKRRLNSPARQCQ